MQTPDLDRVPSRIIKKHQRGSAVVRESSSKPPIFISKNFQHNCVGKHCNDKNQFRQNDKVNS